MKELMVMLMEEPFVVCQIRYLQVSRPIHWKKGASIINNLQENRIKNKGIKRKY